MGSAVVSGAFPRRQTRRAGEDDDCVVIGGKRVCGRALVHAPVPATVSVSHCMATERNRHLFLDITMPLLAVTVLTPAFYYRR